MSRPNRAERFLLIRDAILANLPNMMQTGRDSYQLVRGDFTISYKAPGSRPHFASASVDIWPGRKADPICPAFLLHDGKVANVSWEGDSIFITTYKSGSWEARLLALLA